MNQLKMCGQQIQLRLFMFWPIALKQFNSLTTINAFTWLGGPEVTHPTGVWEVPGSIPESGKDFGVWCLIFMFCYWCFFFHNTLYVPTFCKFFCNVISLRKLTNCKHFNRVYGYQDTGLASLSITVVFIIHLCIYLYDSKIKIIPSFKYT